MKTLPLGLCAPGYWDIGFNNMDEHTNFYPQKCGDKWRLAPYPGLKLLGQTANNLACRGAYPSAFTGFVYSVHGTKIYRTGGPGIVVCTGSLDPVYINSQVEMCDNLSYLMIIDGGHGYYMDFATETITQITDANFPLAPITCTYLNARFIVTSNANDFFYMSQLDTPITWTPSIFTEADIYGDPISALIAGGDRLHVLGTNSYQVYYPSDGSNPFVSVTGATLQIGANRGQYNWAYFREALYFMASTSRTTHGQVFRIIGGSLQKISTPRIEEIIRKSGYGFRGYCYSYGGQDFYEIVQGFDGVNTPLLSFTYNITSGAWFTTNSFVLGVQGARRLRCVVNGANTPLGFDFYDGSIYTLDPWYNTENTVVMRRVVSFVVELTNDTVFHNKIQIALEAKLDSGASGTLNATLTWSDDGGATFNTGYALAKTVVGTTAQKVVLAYDNLGSSVGERRYKLTFPDFPGSIIIRSAEITLDKGGF